MQPEEVPCTHRNLSDAFAMRRFCFCWPRYCCLMIARCFSLSCASFAVRRSCCCAPPSRRWGAAFPPLGRCRDARAASAGRRTASARCLFLRTRGSFSTQGCKKYAGMPVHGWHTDTHCSPREPAHTCTAQVLRWLLTFLMQPALVPCETRTLAWLPPAPPLASGATPPLETLARPWSVQHYPLQAS